MKFSNFKSVVKKWIKPNRLIPLITIFGAGIAILLSLLKIIELSIAGEIIIALLALIAVDALSERLDILEKIRDSLGKLSTGQVLKTRKELVSLPEFANHASEIYIVAISAIGLISRNLDFIEGKLKNGCRVRIVLLDPDSPSVETLRMQAKITSIEKDIGVTLELLKQLAEFSNKSDKLEVRFLKVFLPFAVVAVDPYKDSGAMTVEYRTYKKLYTERPHIYLTKADTPQWFQFYRDQIETAWSDAYQWKPF